jgi:hypothetical protein
MSAGPAVSAPAPRAGFGAPLGHRRRYAIATDGFGQQRFFAGFQRGLFIPLTVPAADDAHHFHDDIAAERCADALITLGAALKPAVPHHWHVVDLSGFQDVA